MGEFTIFFDESGKNSDKPHLMGSLSISQNIYNSTDFNDLYPFIEKKEIHWKRYGGDSVKRIIITNLMTTLLKHFRFIKMNVINYDQSIIMEKSKYFHDVDNRLGDSTIYMKLPERIIYGLLRDYGKLSHIEAEIIIEEATEYKKKNVNLKEQLPRQLNVQAIYRGENFKITSSRYASKGEEVGLELTDIILGMIRTIITNPSRESRKKKAQIELVIQLLQDNRFYKFLQQIRFYEWSSTNRLTEINFDHYLQVFISTNYSLFIENKETSH